MFADKIGGLLELSINLSGYIINDLIRKMVGNVRSI
jgi:hypothetical protein